MGRVASGHVDRERELLRRAKLGDQPFKRLTQVGHGGLGGITVTVRAYARTQLRVSAPHTVFVLFHGVGNVHGPRHDPRLLGLASSSWLASSSQLAGCNAGVTPGWHPGMS